MDASKKQQYIKLWRRFVYKHKLHFVSLCLGAGLTLLFLFIHFLNTNLNQSQRHYWFMQIIDRIDNSYSDLKFWVRGPKLAHPDLALLAIDEESIKDLGQWPWDRKLISQILENSIENGANHIGIDLMFSESSNQEILDWSKQNLGGIPLDKLTSKFDSDKVLATTFSKYNAKLVHSLAYHHLNENYDPRAEVCYFTYLLGKELPKSLEFSKHDFLVADQSHKTSRAPNSFVEWINTNLSKNLTSREQQSFCNESLSRYPLEENAFKEKRDLIDFVNYLQHFQENPIYPVGKFLTNTNKLASRNSQVGFINSHPDSDGTIRNSKLVVRYKNIIIPSLSLRLYMQKQAMPIGQIVMGNREKLGKKKVVKEISISDDFGEKTIPIRSDGFANFAINYTGKKYSYPHIQVSDVLDPSKKKLRVTYRRDGKVVKESFNKKDFLKNKTLILGATALGLYDLRVSVFDENIPGPEIHLNILENLMENSQLIPHPKEDILNYFLLAFLGFVVTGFVVFLPTSISLTLTLACFSTILYVDYFYFFMQNFLTTAWIPAGLCLIIYLSVTLLDHFTAEHTTKKLKKTFQSYVSPAIVNEVLADPENVKLGGHKEHMSVFFSDIRGFTSISEKLSPEELSEVLNLYLTPMTEIVFKNKGTLDKYMGDAVMAFFGAPISSPTHADEACICALESIEELDQINKELKEKQFPILDIGIGINTGFMSVGNMGSFSVRNYTVMGDSVNLGSRLEGINKEYGTRIIVSEFTIEALKNNFIFREIDWVKVKGKKKPVKIYELIGRGIADGKQKTFLDTFKKAYALYHERKWTEAYSLFEECLNHKKDDPVAIMYMIRIDNYMDETPDDDWDGVFVMKTK